MASRRARRGAGDQERRDEGDAARLQARRAPPSVPDRHAGREPSRRVVVAIRLSDAGTARRGEALWPRLSHADREEERRRAARRAGLAAEAVSAAPDKGPGGPRAAAQDRNRQPARTRRTAARSVRDRAPRDARQGAPRNRREGLCAQPHRDPRRAAEAAAGVLRPASRQARGGAQGRRPAPSSNI